MIKLYLIISVCAIVIGAYFYGKNVGNSKCEIQNYQEQINATSKNERKERLLNDKVYKTGLGDIRRVLRDKYTIAE